MRQITSFEPIDYLAIGHITKDLTLDGHRVGGTVAYSALTAQSFGLRVGIVTSWAMDVDLGPLKRLPIANYAAESSTTFENIESETGRIQYLHESALDLSFQHIPDPWRNVSIVHLAPVNQEVDPSLVRNFPSALIGLTPQGWLRSHQADGRVYPGEWPEASFVLDRSGAAVIGLEDIGGDEGRIEEMASACPVLAVTEGGEGVRIYWNGDVRRFRPPNVDAIDTTGAGDIFAAAFFIRLYSTRDPWEAARFATQLAAISVTRRGLDGIPTSDEVNEYMVEVI
ncbi:MAG: PfkB family carbohydrate kinase [Anaerolineales bacterium]|jgi:sugar/nucleoside kinase (ribokinase family)